MKTRICTTCSKEFPATAKYFYRQKGGKYGLRPDCKSCNRIVSKGHYQKNRTLELKKCEERYHTLAGYLYRCFFNIKNRCTNPKTHNYQCYGGRGIKCLFESFDDFYNYIIYELGYDTYKKIKGLQIDRIDNDENYRKGNIRFVTAKTNSNNRRSRKKRK